MSINKMLISLMFFLLSSFCVKASVLVKQNEFNPRVKISEQSFRPNYEILNENGTSAVSRGVLSLMDSRIVTKTAIKFALWESRNIDPDNKKRVEKYKIKIGKVTAEFLGTSDQNISSIKPEMLKIYINEKLVTIGAIEDIESNPIGYSSISLRSDTLVVDSEFNKIKVSIVMILEPGIY